VIEAGQQVLHYRLIEKVGEGGMGVIWRAEDTRLHRHVALKFVPEKHAEDAQAVDRHLREARAASALNHPHICSIHDIGEWQGQRFIVMELLEGRSLQDCIGGKPMEVGAAIDLAVQIVDALEAAHSKGIIHRDVKPANLFVTERGQAKVLDFGLAKLEAGPVGESTPDAATRTDHDVTTPGSVVGTVAFMSPEQALGKELDQRTDIFSFGAVLYQMVTGRRAFEGDTSAALFDAILNRAPTPSTGINAAVPADLELIVKKALEKDPDLRYQSAAEMRGDLERMQPGQSRDSATALTSRSSGVSERRPWRAAAMTIASLIVITAAVVLWQSFDRTTPPAVRESSKGPSIAVLSFVNASGDPQQDYFSSGLTDDIITELSRYTELFVVARTLTPDFEGGSVDVRAAGAALGVRYVLQGRVQKAGERIRVTVQLSDTRDGRSLWGDRYERDLTASDLFSLQDELTQHVVNAITGSYGVLSRSGLAEARRKPPSSLDSYDCVLRAYEYLHVHSPAKHMTARDCLEAAVELDTDYAEGLAWLAYLYVEEFHHRRNERPDSYDSRDRALEFAERAVELDPVNQVSQGALGMTLLLRGDRERGRAAAGRAIELNPNNAMWLGLLGSWVSARGDFDRGVPWAQKALELDPNPPPWLRMPMFLDHYHNGRYEAALVEAQNIDTDDYRTPLFLAAAYGQLGRLDEAKRALTELQTGRPWSADSIRQDMTQRNGCEPELVDRLLEGLGKAGFEVEP